MKELKVLIVDDSVSIRVGLERAFSQIQGCVIVGMAVDGVEGVDKIHALRPHVVILDIAMPHKGGIQVLRDIRQEGPKMVIIMFTADPSIVLKEVCLEAGANYYLDKSQLRDLLDICRELKEGHWPEWM